MHAIDTGAVTDPCGALARRSRWQEPHLHDCHDLHGSSNYRLLKDVVNGNTVGGYVGTEARPRTRSVVGRGRTTRSSAG